MDDLGRLLLRFLLVPLGGVIATLVAVAVVMVANRGALDALAGASPEQQGDFVFALVEAAPVLFAALSATVTLTLAPAALGALIAEIFAIRSWIFHVANGVLAAWIGWSLAAGPDGDLRLFSAPTVPMAAGIAAGLVYWLIAGSSAGFFRPLRKRETIPPERAPPLPPA